MRIFAYCTEVAREAVAAATGVEPVTSPPVTAASFDLEWLAGHDVLYFRLHGLPGQTGWFGEGKLYESPLALARAQVEMADLGGAVAVVANCFGADEDPMIEALYRAGASTVIAGSGENEAARRFALFGHTLGYPAVGTDLLVKWLLRGLRMGMLAPTALALAKVRLVFTAWRASDRDAREFTIIGRKDEQAKVV